MTASSPAPDADALVEALKRLQAQVDWLRNGMLFTSVPMMRVEDMEVILADRLAQPAPDAQSAQEATDLTGAMWRANLHNFLDVAAGEGLVLGGIDAADLYMAVFPDEYKAACDPLASKGTP